MFETSLRETRDEDDASDDEKSLKDEKRFDEGQQEDMESDWTRCWFADVEEEDEEDEMQT